MFRSRQIWALALVAMFFVPAIAKAQFKTGDWELTLAANAAHGPDFNGVSGGGNGSIGYFFTPNIELGVRQGVTYSDIGGRVGSKYGFQTNVPLDYHFDLGRWQPFIGVNIGFIAGNAVANTFNAGP